MRVEKAPRTGEKRDAISHDWLKYFRVLEWEPVLLPNRLGGVEVFLEHAHARALILTGGDDVGAAPERDSTEEQALAFFVRRKLPVMGVCRGMQMINRFFGGSLRRELGRVTRTPHVGASHLVTVRHLFLRKLAGKAFFRTNSFHHQGITERDLAKNLVGLAETGEVVEALIHRVYPVVGVQWHPERPGSCAALDRRIFALVRRGFSLSASQ